MSDQIVLEPGAMPWKPSADTELVDVFHRYTIPLVGQIRQNGHEFLFWCVVGHAGPEGAWAYAPATSDGFEALRTADQDTFDDRLRAATESRATHFAMASDDKGIIVAAEVDPPANFDDIYERGMPLLNEKIREVAEELQMLMERFPMRLPNVAPTRFGEQLLSRAAERSA